LASEIFSLKLIFIYGLPASGKLTVAQELATMTGLKLFHNHVVVNLLLDVFEFGSPSFIELREKIWIDTFTQACRSQLPGLIFTFAPEATVCPDFISNAVTAVTDAGGEIDFIELACPLSEIRHRIASPSRFQHKKLTSLQLFEELHAAGSLDTSSMPKPKLSIDTSRSTASEAAEQIVRALELPLSHPVAPSTFH
jgi:hypothetical protein